MIECRRLPDESVPDAQRSLSSTTPTPRCRRPPDESVPDAQRAAGRAESV